MAEPVLFVGPTAFGLPANVFADAGVRPLPPVRRDDVARLVKAAEPGVMIICDGVFGTVPAVSHGELCEAVDAGWQVWGVSSLGAIRAYELRHEGMRGFGGVYAMFERYDDFADDEMCLLHAPEPPYFPVTEPLVNIRHALEKRGAELGVEAVSARLVIDALRALWFGDRSPERILSVLRHEGRMAAADAQQLMAWLTSHRLKSLDLAQLLATRPWTGRPARVGTP